MPLLFDLGDVPACHCDFHLESLAKALAEDPAGAPEAMWEPHENPWITALVEDVTRRLLAISARILDVMTRALRGESIGDLAKAESHESQPWMRWDETRFDETRRYLEGKSPRSYTLDDWLLLAEFIVNRYCPDGVIQSLAEYAVLRATLLGKLQASAAAIEASPKMVEEMVELVPTEFAKVPPRVLSPAEKATIRVAKARAGESIALAVDGSKHRMKQIIIEHVQAQVLGQREGNAAHLQTRLFDNFGTLNRDFRRIAVTEAGECCNQGFISAMGPGRQVKRLEAYRGACPFCKSINGKVFGIVAPDAREKNGNTEIWEGKTNVGRSASPRRRGPEGLVERSEGELWWVASGVQHPMCRGSWTPVVKKPPAVSQAFDDWARKRLAAVAPDTRPEEREEDEN